MADVGSIMSDDHHSITSFEDFEREHVSRFAPMIQSEYKSEESEAESEPSGPWDPPAWRTAASGFYSQRYLFPPPSSSPSRSRFSSPPYGSAEDRDVNYAANIPLPESPLKTTPSNSPEPEPRPQVENVVVEYEVADSPSSSSSPSSREPSASPPQEDANNCMYILICAEIQHADQPDIRFSMRAEVQHRTEPIDSAVSWFRRKYDSITKSRSSTILAVLTALLATTILRSLFQAPTAGPLPDLVKVAVLAKSFEPMIYYTENGVQHMGELQETGVAVWDLSESVRFSNMTSAPIIVKELDELSDSLKGLAIELTRFFASVNGDVDE